MLNFRSNQKSKPSNKKAKRKLRNENLEFMLKSSETLLEDFIELECQVNSLCSVLHVRYYAGINFSFYSKSIGKLKCVSNNVDITVKKVLLQQK